MDAGYCVYLLEIELFKKSMHFVEEQYTKRAVLEFTYRTNTANFEASKQILHHLALWGTASKCLFH